MLGNTSQSIELVVVVVNNKNSEGQSVTIGNVTVAVLLNCLLSI